MKPAFIEEMDAIIQRYGSERDALNVVLAKLQEARAWIIAQEICPDCHGHLKSEEERTAEGHIWFDYICCQCNSRWLSIGLEIKS